MTLTTKQALKIAGSLSSPSKMPCHGYSIPARRCIAGSKLAKVQGSTCHECYALKGNYRFGNVQRALEYRFRSLKKRQWVDAMVVLINATNNPYFRWHDSGDLQSVAHLERIAEVCRRTPRVKHWLPTREYKIVADYRAQAEIPANLCIRLSAHMIDKPAPQVGLPTSTVNSTQASNPLPILNSIPSGTRYCPAQSQGNKCLECRACWDQSVANVSYHVH